MTATAFSIRRQNNPPCHKCPERAAECHTTCERYKEYAEKQEQTRQRRYKDNQITEAEREITHHRVTTRKRGTKHE